MSLQTPSRRPPATTSALQRHMPLAMAAIAIAIFVGAELIAPDPLELPLISILTLAIAAMIALVAWATGAPRQGENVTAWDLAGAFTLIGCAAAMLTQNEQALEYFIGAKSK